MTKLRVFLADDHPILRAGLRWLIDTQPDMVTAGEAADGATAVREVIATRPDVVVMDVSMPGTGGAVAAGEITRAWPEARVVALSAHEDQGYVREMIRAGAVGYVVKRAVADDLVRAVRVIAAGGTYLDPSVAGPLVSGVTGSPQAQGKGAADLSDREAEVLRLLAQGHAVKAIAATLDISARTVETYKARGMEKIGVRTRADLVRYAVQQGWLAT